MNTKLVKSAVVAVIAACALASLPAMARHGHGHRGGGLSLGFVFGAPAYYGPRYYAPYYDQYYYYPPYPVAPAPYVPPAPTAYIERDIAPSAPEQPAGYWYYCAESRAYYPYVRQCPGAWQQVAPQPAS